MRRRLVLAIATLTGAPAEAEPIELELATARQVSRAGATLVSDDGVGALRSNPASLARQAATRLELGLAVRDLDASFHAAGADDSPTIRDRGAPATLPSLMIAASLGRFVLAAAVTRGAAVDRALPAAEADQQPDDVRRLFPHRYGGTASRVAMRTAMLGAAVRATDWLGVGAALHLSDVEIAETRTLWAGFAGRDEVGDPSRDLRLALAARDPLVVGGALGVLLAPPDLPIELALAVRGHAAIRASGPVALEVAHTGAAPAPVLDAPRGRVLVRAPLTLQAGVRYLGDRITLEASVAMARLSDRARAPRWRLAGVAARDDSGLVARVDEVPSLFSQQSHTTVRGAIDLEVARGFLWLVAGYAFATAATPTARIAPSAGDLGGHTAAVGAEASWDDVTIGFGYARSFTAARTDVATGAEVLLLDPFAPETAAAAPGAYDSAADTVALEVRVAWP